MDSFLKIAISRPVFISMIEVFLMVLGFLSFLRLGVDLFPDINPPIITITAKYPGAGPKEVETLLTKPLEEEVSQVAGIEQLQSTAMEGLTQIMIRFKLERNAQEALADVRDRVSRIGSALPDDVEEPLVQRLDFDDRPIFRVALSSHDARVTPSKLRLLAENELKDKLTQIDGVGQIDVYGGKEREVRIELDRKRLMLWKLTPADISRAVQKTNSNIPAGQVYEEPARRSLRVIGEYSSMSAIENTIVKTLPQGKQLLIKDLAEVRDTFKEVSSMARLDGKPVVFVEIKKQSGINTVALADDIKKKLPTIQKKIGSGIESKIIFDGARRINLNVNEVLETMAIATLLTIIVVFFFLGSFQSTLITGLAIPTSIIATFFALELFGYTINIMTLLGLTLAVGLIVDDAIVVRENIWNKIEKGMSPKEASFYGTKEVLIAVIATSLVLLATFLPVAFIPGIVGRFLAAFALTVCMAIVFSTYDALTIAPMLSAYLISKKSTIKKEPSKLSPLYYSEALFSFTHKVYVTLLGGALKHPLITLFLAVGVFAFSLTLFKKVGFTFMPISESGEIEVAIEAPTGTTLSYTNFLIQKVEKTIEKSPMVDFYSTSVGGALGEKNVARVFIKMIPEGERDMRTSEFKELLRQTFSSFAKMENLELQVGNAEKQGGSKKQMQITIQGPDNKVLTELSNTIIEKIRKEIPNIVDLETNLKPGSAELQFVIDAKRMAAFGLNTVTVGNALRGLFDGEIATYYRENDEEYDMRVILNEADRTYLGSVRNITIPNDRGEAIPLVAIVHIKRGVSPTKISRIDRSRAVKIEGDLAPKYPLGVALKEVKKLVTPLLPDGYTLEFFGQAQNLKDLQIGFMVSILLGSLFIYMIMASLYESIVIPFSILLTLPLTIVGILAAMLISGRLLDIYGIIGLILLLGLVTKNAILLIDYAEQAKADGKSGFEAIYQAGIRRFRPILMTAISTIAGMSPIAFGLGEINQERASMGIAAIGGLISSTFLSLLVIPCAYIYLDRFRDWSLGKVRGLSNESEG